MNNIGLMPLPSDLSVGEQAHLDWMKNDFISAHISLSHPANLKRWKIARAIVVATLITSLAFLVMMTRGRSIQEGFHHISKKALITSLSITGFCVAMTSYVFYKAIYGRDLLVEELRPFLEKTIEGTEMLKLAEEKKFTLPFRRGTFIHQQQALEQSHVSGIYFSESKQKNYPLPNFKAQLIDTSTLDDTKTGFAYSYNLKDEGEPEIISLGLFLGHLDVPGRIVYNIARAVWMPLYIIGRSAYEELSGKKRTFELLQAPEEFLKSIWTAVQAPFYMLAISMGAIYTWIDPEGGRKLISSLERNRNYGTSLTKSFWLAGGGFQTDFEFEGGMGQHIGKWGYYTAGCYQPAFLHMVKKEEIVYSINMKGMSARSYTKQSLAQTTSFTEHSNHVSIDYQFQNKAFSAQYNFIDKTEIQDFGLIHEEGKNFLLFKSGRRYAFDNPADRELIKQILTASSLFTALFTRVEEPDFQEDFVSTS